MTRAVLYARQSLKKGVENEQTSLSLVSQEQACREHADRAGWDVVGAVRDHDLKGYDPTRPALAEALGAVESGRADVLVVHALDRLAADLVIQELTWRRIKAAGARLVSVTEPHAENDLVRGMFGVIAQYRKTVLGDKLRAAFATQRRRGVHHGQAPYGYRHAGEPTIVVDPAEDETTRQILAWGAEGLRCQRIALRLGEAGVRGRRGAWWTAPTIQRMLANPAYAGGLRTTDGPLWPAEGEAWHVPFVDRATWDRIQGFAERRPHTRTKTVESWLDGRVRHACGARMYLVAGVAGNVRQTPQLRCVDAYRGSPDRCHLWPRQASLRNVEAAARQALAADLAGALTVREVTDAAARDVATADAVKARAAIERKVAALEQRAARAEALYLDGRRDLVWLRGQEAEIATSRAALDREIAALPRVRDRADVAATVALLVTVRDDLAAATDDVLGLVLDQIGEVVVEDGCARLRYLPDVAVCLPTPTAVPIPRLRRRNAT